MNNGMKKNTDMLPIKKNDGQNVAASVKHTGTFTITRRRREIREEGKVALRVNRRK